MRFLVLALLLIAGGCQSGAPAEDAAGACTLRGFEAGHCAKDDY